MLDGGERLGAVECDGLAVRLDLLAAVCPQPRIPEGRRVSKRMAQRLTKRVSGLLHRRGCLDKIIPCLRHCDARFLKPVRAIDEGVAAPAGRNGFPLPIGKSKLL